MSISRLYSCDNFDEANQAYFNQNYERASELYRACLDRPSYALYSNLGSSYFKLNDLGKSHYHFLKAQQQNPDHPNLTLNLGLIQELLIDQESSEFLNEVKSSGSFEYKILWFMIMLSGFGFLVRRKIGRWLLLSGVLLSVIWTWYHRHSLLESKNYGVVLEKEQTIFSNQNLHASAVTKVHSGKLLKIVSEHGEWARVAVKPGLQGWVPISVLGKL